MRHEGANHCTRLPPRKTRRGVIDCLEQAELSHQSFGGKPLQIQACLFRRHHQRKRRCIRRNDQVLRQSAFKAEARHAKRTVLVVEARVDRVVAGFRHAPRYATLLAILDLPCHRRLAGLIE